MTQKFHFFGNPQKGYSVRLPISEKVIGRVIKGKDGLWVFTHTRTYRVECVGGSTLSTCVKKVCVKSSRIKAAREGYLYYLTQLSMIPR